VSGAFQKILTGKAEKNEETKQFGFFSSLGLKINLSASVQFLFCTSKPKQFYN
jgi:hypothetical protein